MDTTKASYAKAARMCERCGERPRAAGGKVSRCLSCLRVDVDRDRQERQARRRERDACRSDPS